MLHASFVCLSNDDTGRCLAYWATQYVKFLRLDTINRSHLGYAAFKEVLAYDVLYHHHATHGEPFLQTTGSHHEVTTRGKCLLHGKRVSSCLHPTSETFCLLMLLGRFSLTEAWEGWEPSEEDEEPRTYPTHYFNKQRPSCEE